MADAKPNNEEVLMQQNMQMMQQMNQMQAQMNNMNEQIEYKTLDKKLEEYDHGMIICQKLDLLELFTGCERENVYEVYKRDANGKKKGKSELTFKEKSTCCNRNFCKGPWKTFKMKCYNEQKVQDEEECMRSFKDCKCVCCCWNREELLVWHKEKGSEEKYLGKVYDNCDICNFSFGIYDDSGSETTFGVLEFKVTASCCQTYFWCQCPCKSCNHVDFEIKDAEGQLVGALAKKGKDCCMNMIVGEAMTELAVDFPKGSNWRQRAMLVNLAIFIDYVMFEESSESNNQGAML